MAETASVAEGSADLAAVIASVEVDSAVSAAIASAVVASEASAAEADAERSRVVSEPQLIFGARGQVFPKRWQL